MLPHFFRHHFQRGKRIQRRFYIFAPHPPRNNVLIDNFFLHIFSFKIKSSRAKLSAPAVFPYISLHAFPFPYVKPSPCLKKNSVNFIFSAKMISLFHRLPLGGKLLAKQGDEGQPNNIQAISLQKAALYSTHVPGFPVGEAGGFCRRKRSLQAFFLPEKNSVTFIFRQKLSTTSSFPLSSTLSPSKVFPPLLVLHCYIPAFVAPALPVRFNPRFSSYPLFSKTISRRNPFAPDRCFRRKHNYYLITFPKTPFIVPRFFILNANICSFFYSITYKTCQHIAIFRKIFHFFYRLF